MEFEVPLRFSAFVLRVQAVAQAGREATLPAGPLDLLARLMGACEAQETESATLLALAHGLVRWSLDQGCAEVPAHQLVSELGSDLWSACKLMQAYERLYASDLAAADRQTLGDALAALLGALADDLTRAEAQWRQALAHLRELLEKHPQLAVVVEPTGLQYL